MVPRGLISSSAGVTAGPGLWLKVGFASAGFGRSAGLAAAFGLLLLGSGCALLGGRAGPTAAEQRAARQRAEEARALKGPVAGGHHRVSIPELDQLTYAYADRYYMVVRSAVDAIKRGNPDPGQRRRAHQALLNGVLAMNDIVSGNDPYAQTLDLVVSVTLQSILVIDENYAEQVLGDRAPILIKAARTMRVEAWDLAAKVLTQDQLELLDYLILEWRRTHPDIEQVAFVKFDDFASVRAAGLITAFKGGRGFLAPVSEATQELNDWRRLAERSFWYAKRAPNIAAIQAEGAVNEILAAPEVGSLLQSAQRLSKTAEAAPQTLIAERKALFAELDARQTLLTNTLGDVRQIVQDARSLGGAASLLATNAQQTLGALRDTLQIADTVGRDLGVGQPPINPRARPFDIQDYITAMSRLNEVVTNAHALSLSAGQLTRSEDWNKALQAMSQAGERVVNRAFILFYLGLGLAFLLAVAYRVISVRVRRRAPPTVEGES